MSKFDVLDRARAQYEILKSTLPSGLVQMFDIQMETLRRYDPYVLRGVEKGNSVAICVKEELDWYNNVALWVKNDPEAFNTIVDDYARAIKTKDRDAQQVAYDKLEMMRKLKGLEVIPNVPIYPLM